MFIRILLTLIAIFSLKTFSDAQTNQEAAKKLGNMAPKQIKLIRSSLEASKVINR